MNSFRKLMDTPECHMLLELYPDAFILISMIALKARQNNKLAFMGLSKGQAFLGNNRCGMTESKFRNAKRKLVKFGLVSFKSTSRGAIATILDTRIYNINTEPDDEQIAIKQQVNNDIPGNSVSQNEQIKITGKPEPDHEIIREKINEPSSELNAMFKEKVIEPLKSDMPRKFWETYIEPLVIKSLDESGKIAYLYHGHEDSYVDNHFRSRIEKKLGMAVKFVLRDG